MLILSSLNPDCSANPTSSGGAHPLRSVGAASALAALVMTLAGCGGAASSADDASGSTATGQTGTTTTPANGGGTATAGTDTPAAAGSEGASATDGTPAATTPGGTVTTGDPVTVTPVPPSGGAVASYTYQAKDNFMSGGVTTSSGNYLQGFSATGARVVFAVNASSAGTRQVTLRYANGTSATNTLNLYVNGVLATTTSLAPTGAATTWANRAETVSLRAGLNTISYQRDAGNSGQVNLNQIDVPGGTALAVRGATVPYIEYEAENGNSNVAADAASTSYLTASAEASGRQSRTLSASGHYVEWVAQKTANTLTVRYSMPDAAQGGGTNNTLSLYVNGSKVRSLNLSSKYAWVYGDYPFDNTPSNGSAHRFFDETSFADLSIAAGATVRLQKDGGDTASYYKIDLVDMEQADAAYAMPANFVSVTNYGAVANDGQDDSTAINNAISDAKAKNKGVWLPAGTFNIADHIHVAGVQVRGAGIWHTTLQGSNGKGGFLGTGSGVTIADLTVRGDSTARNDSDDQSAFEGTFGSGSLIQNVWVEHTKVGMWLGATDGLYMVGGRIRDTWADGVNLSGGVHNTTVSHFNLRNTGDDAMAMWSNGSANVNNSFRFNSAQLPILANTFAIYGGQDNKILDNIGTDTVTSSAGIAISNRFNPIAFSGTTEIRRNTLNRAGGYDGGFNSPIGALYIYVDGVANNAPIVVDTLEVNDSKYDGMQVSYGASVASLTLSDVRFNNSGTYGMNFTDVSGNGTFSGVTVNGAKSGAVNNPSGKFTINRGANNTGW